MLDVFIFQADIIFKVSPLQMHSYATKRTSRVVLTAWPLNKAAAPSLRAMR